MINFSDLPDIISGELIAFFSESPVTHLLTDSRKAVPLKGSLFFALKGPNHDGHNYLAALYEQGVRQFVVSRQDIPALPEANVIQVPDTLRALQQLAAFHRGQFTYPVVGISGSNGKTIVKEWLSQMLAPHRKVMKSPGSYNSQLGVPLAVWGMAGEHDLALVEAGISRTDEMHRLEKVIQPTAGIFTNLRSAHDEGFTSRQQKADEKAQLFRNTDYVVYCADYPEITRALSRYSGVKPVAWCTTTHPDAALYALVDFTRRVNETDITLHYGEDRKKATIRCPFTDAASLENCAHIIIYLLHEGFEVAGIQEGILRLKPLAMRLELKEGLNNCYLIDDSYSNDLAGLQIALDFLRQQKQRNYKVLVISDLLETGKPFNELYQQVAGRVEESGVNLVIGIGKEISKQQHRFSIPAYCFPDVKHFLESEITGQLKNAVILVKGARLYGLEQVVLRLTRKIHRTTLSINLDALTHNLNFYRSRLKPGTKVMVMVKAFSYGGGSFEIASHLQFHRVDYLAVAYTDEAVSLRSNGITLPILILNPAPDNFDQIILHQLEPEISNFFQLQSLKEVMANRPPDNPVSVHIKIDTGMHRLGFMPEEVDKLGEQLAEFNQIKVASIFTHLAGADEEMHNAFSKKQVTRYDAAYEKIKTTLGYAPLRHVVNSAGILRFPEYHFDMVRLGIGLYGVEVNQMYPEALRPISKLETVISQIKPIRKGETVGYSRAGKASTDLRTATIAIGYADGFSRGFSRGKASVCIHGKYAPVIGNVCMDMTMVDVTHIPEASPGDPVEIFGEQQSVTTLAQALGTIPYEILTHISERVRRVYYTA